MKNLIIFDLDGTLAESKSPLDRGDGELLGQLLAVVQVAVISGGAWPQFQNSCWRSLPDDDGMKNLSLAADLRHQVLSPRRRCVDDRLFRGFQRRGPQPDLAALNKASMRPASGPRSAGAM